MKKITLFFIILSMQLFANSTNEIINKYTNNKNVCFDIKLNSGDELYKVYLRKAKKHNMIAVEQNNLLLYILKRDIANITLVTKPYAVLVNKDRISGTITEKSTNKIIKSSLWGKIIVKNRNVIRYIKTIKPFVNEVFPKQVFTYGLDSTITIQKLDYLKHLKHLPALHIKDSGNELDFNILANFTSLQSLRIDNVNSSKDILFDKFKQLKSFVILNSTINGLVLEDNISQLKSLEMNNIKFNKAIVLNKFKQLSSLKVKNIDMNKLIIDENLPIKYLFIGNSQRNNNDFLSKFKELAQVTMLNTKIDVLFEDFKKLENLHLENHKGKILGVKNLPLLKDLIIVNSTLKSLALIENVPDLISLDLESNKLTSIEKLIELPSLRSLSLHDNAINNTKSIERFRDLTYLDLSNNKITELNNIDKLLLLEGLEVQNNPLSSIANIKDLESLSHLDISNTKVKDISFAKKVDTLKALGLELINTDISNFNVSSIYFSSSSITKFPEDMEEIYFYFSDKKQVKYITENNNNITAINFSLYKGDFDFVKDLPPLDELDFSNTSFADLSLLKNQKESMFLLNLRNSKVQDFSFIHQLEGLEYLDVSLGKKEFKALKNKLPSHVELANYSSKN